MTVEWTPASALANVACGKEEDVSAAYAELLGKAPVALHAAGEGHQMWGIFSHAEVAKAAMDTETFSNITVPEGSPRILPLMADPPEHGGYRRIINKHFGAAPVARTEAEMRPVAITLIEEMIARGTADFAADYAYQFSLRTLCSFLRVEADWNIFNDWSAEMERLTGGGTAAPADGLPMETLMQVMPYIRTLIGERRALPSDDLISSFVAEEVNGENLSEDTIIGLVIAVILAGKSTTASAISNLVLRLSRHPDLQRFLRENPDRIPDAVEESLRLEAPQQEMPRTARRNVQIGNETIRAGDGVFLNYGSANVDPARWESPDKFDLDRKPRQHFAFGRGIHQCFGAPLARMQIKLTISELLARTTSFELAGDIERLTWPRLSVEKLPLRFTARN